MLRVDEMSRDERRAAKEVITVRTQAVIDAYNDSTKAREAVEALVKEYGYSEAVMMVATVINRVSLGDGRIYDGIREWAQNTHAPSNEQMHALDIYGVDSWIHSAHVNEIGQAMRKYEPTEEDLNKGPVFYGYVYDLMGESEPEEDEEPKRTKAEVIADIIEAFEADEDIFNACIEELDSYNGYLGDDRYYSMEDLDELYRDQEPTEILTRAFYGYDETYGCSDRREAFNPNRDWFYFNGYGNLVSSDWKDYSDKIDEYAVEQMSDNRRRIDSIEDDAKISALFDELEECEE